MIRTKMIVAAFLGVVGSLHAADDAGDVRAPVLEGKVAVAVGGAWVEGDKAAFERRFQQHAGPFGGIEELRYRRETERDVLTMDARLMPGLEDYEFLARWNRDERLTLELGYDQFRTFYDGSGYVFRPNNAGFKLHDERMHVDRSRLWLQIGFSAEDLPRLRLRYEYLTRKGEKPSTEMGETNLTGGLGARSIVPAFWDLDETRHAVSLDADRRTRRYQWGAGARYEHAEYTNARHTARRPAEAAAARTVSTQEQVQTDLFATHGYYQRNFTEKLTGSVGALVTTLDTNLTGSRIYGPDYDPIFDPVFARRQVGDLGFLNLDGGTQLKQYVFNGTIVYRPHKHWLVRPALRYEHLRTDGISTFVSTNVLNNLTTLQQQSEAASEKTENRTTESIEVRYTGQTGFTYTARGEWHQGRGDLEEWLRLPDTQATVIDRAIEYSRDTQKYTLTAQWHGRPGLTITSEYYYKARVNDYDAWRDSTPATGFDRYPAFITDQDFETHDFNLRVSWRASPKLSLVTRYDYQRSTVATSFAAIPETRGGRTNTHIISQSVTWLPRPQLYVSGSVNVAFDQLTTPASGLIRHSDNNYLNAMLSAGYALGKRSDLYMDASRYRARDYTDNSSLSLPYGADAKTDTVSLTYVFRASSAWIYTVKYTYATGEDRLFRDGNHYRAHVLYSKVQYSF